jgi:DNA-binding NarL/FixJ family response regulator
VVVEQDLLLRNMDTITVLIADAHILLRRSLRRFLAQQRNILVVGEAANSRQVLSRMEALQPHILLLGVRMPKMEGLKGLPRIRAKSPHTKILLLADAFEEDFIASALQDGVHGCVLSTISPMEFAKVICTIHAGEFWVQRKLLTQVVSHLRQRVDELEGSPSKLLDVLSDREHEVVIWAAHGMTNNEIAIRLGISAKTVKTHLQNVFRKLKIRRRVQLSALSPYLASHIASGVPQPQPRDRQT